MNDLETVWNGAHNGRGDDLLLTERTVPQRPPTPPNPRRASVRFLTPTQRAACIAAAQRMSLKRAGQLFGISPSSVQWLLERAGIRKGRRR